MDADFNMVNKLIIGIIMVEKSEALYELPTEMQWGGSTAA